MNYDQGQAPRITREMIINDIASFEFVNACDIHPCSRVIHHGNANLEAGLQGRSREQAMRVTFCIMIFKSGAIVTGQSICAHIANYDKQKGESAAYENAISNAWPLFGFALASRLGEMACYVDKEGHTRDPDGELSFSQFAYSCEARDNLLSWLGTVDKGPLMELDPQHVREVTGRMYESADGPVQPESTYMRDVMMHVNYNPKNVGLSNRDLDIMRRSGVCSGCSNNPCLCETQMPTPDHPKTTDKMGDDCECRGCFNKGEKN